MTSAPAATARLLVVEENPQLCRMVQTYLEPFGYDIQTAADGHTAVVLALRGDFHAVLLDALLPGLSGFETLRRIRESSTIPVLLLTGCDSASERIAGLELGADDCIPKTYSPRELLARLRAVLRRSRPAVGGPRQEAQEAEAPLVIGPLSVHPEWRAAFFGERDLALTPIEFDLLHSLARDCGRVKTREELLADVAGRDFDTFDRSIDVHISSLRRKLGDDPKAARWIVTIRSAGYLLRAQENAL